MKNVVLSFSPFFLHHVYFWNNNNNNNSNNSDTRQKIRMLNDLRELSIIPVTMKQEIYIFIARKITGGKDKTKL